MKVTLSEIDNIIERRSQWTRHREAMQIMGALLRTPGAGRRLSDILTQEQLELVMLPPIEPHLGRLTSPAW